MSASTSNKRKKVHYERGTRDSPSHHRSSSRDSGIGSASSSANDRASIRTIHDSSRNVSSPLSNKAIEDQRHNLAAVTEALHAANVKIQQHEASTAALNALLTENYKENRILKREKSDLFMKIEDLLDDIDNERKLLERPRRESLSRNSSPRSPSLPRSSSGSSTELEEGDESIFSDFQETTYSQSTTGISMSLSTEVFALLHDDEKLGHLYPVALQVMSKQKFSHIFEELIGKFAKEASAEARVDIEAQSAAFVGKRSRYLAKRLAQELDHNRPGALTEASLQSEKNSAKQELLEEYLRSLNGSDGIYRHSADPIVEREIDERSDSGQSEAETFVLTKHLKNFLTSCVAWKDLQARFEETVEAEAAKNKTVSSLAVNGEEKVAVLDPSQLIQEKISASTQSLKAVLRWEPFCRIYAIALAVSNCLFNAIRGKLLTPGISRIEWTCKCGFIGWDDYTEVAEGGIASLADDLNKSKAIAHANVTDRAKAIPGALSTSFNNLSVSFAKFIKAWTGKKGLPTRESTEVAVADSSGSLIVPVQDPRYLLFCTESNKGRRKVPTFQHIDICSTKSDQELFTSLKNVYSSGRSRFTLWTSYLQAIHFLEFEIRPKSYIDCLEYPRIPPPEKRELEYEWDPEVTLALPPIGSNWMMHIFDCPEDASDSQMCVTRFPKKLRDRLEFGRDERGWGIYFEDSRHWGNIVVFIAVVGFLGSLAFGIYWNIVMKDIQGAWGVAGWMVAAIGLLLFALHASVQN